MFIANASLAALLKTAHMRCSYAANGCSSIIPYEDIDKHELLCLYKSKASLQFADFNKITTSILHDPSFHARKSQNKGLQEYDSQLCKYQVNSTSLFDNNDQEIPSSFDLKQESLQWKKGYYPLKPYSTKMLLIA
jgi:hypothetical protein